MMELSRFHVESPYFVKDAPSSLVVGWNPMSRQDEVHIGKHAYAIDADNNPMRQVEGIAAFHMRRYPAMRPWKTPFRRPKA